MNIHAGAGCTMQGSTLPAEPASRALVLWRLARLENDRMPRDVCEALGIVGSPEPDVAHAANLLGCGSELRALRERCAP